LNRYEFLEALHELVKPKIYLEIGVQYGGSLNLAHQAEVAIGIDPNPLAPPKGNQVLFSMTSDAYFGGQPELPGSVDLAFIDGMHLYEYALRDFINVEQRCHANSVVVFDDVLPYNNVIAGREQIPGDWTGDVWKVFYILGKWRSDLELCLVDTFPTGALVALQSSPNTSVRHVYPAWLGGDDVPDEIINRRHAVTPGVALDWVRERIYP
jgi:hypothetical protein